MVGVNALKFSFKLSGQRVKQAMDGDGTNRTSGNWVCNGTIVYYYCVVQRDKGESEQAVTQAGGRGGYDEGLLTCDTKRMTIPEISY